MFSCYSIIAFLFLLHKGFSFTEIPITDEVVNGMFFNNEACLGRNAVNTISNPSCYSKTCTRAVVDGLFADGEARKLLDIAKKGMATRQSVGGPTILDINTGYIRDSNGLDNLFSKDNSIFDEVDFAVYGAVINKLKQAVENTFNISNVFFTAPTFITRLDGRSDWEPQGVYKYRSCNLIYIYTFTNI